MITKLENQYLCVEISSYGAELTSLILKENQTEYLWGAQSDIWGRHAPVLFPIVGRLINNQYKVDNHIFEMSQHGFARDFDFVQMKAASEYVVYRLTSNEKTLVQYPYHFQLDIGYRLQGTNIIVEYCVKNIDHQPIYFSIGAHPGFNCPLSADEKLEDYYLEFEQKETAYKYCLENGFPGKRELFLRDDNSISLSKNLFKDDALVFENLQSTQIALKSRKSSKSVTVNYEGFPYLGIWSKDGGAPFVCIEPWCGIADAVGQGGHLKEKKGIECLEPEQEFKRKYSISLT